LLQEKDGGLAGAEEERIKIMREKEKEI